MVFSNNKSILFDGVDDRIDCGSDSSLQYSLSSTFSWSAWINVDAAHLGEGVILSNKVGGANEGIRLYVDGDILKAEMIASGNSQSVVDGTSVILKSSWHHVAFTYDGSSDRSGMKLYVDGVLVNAPSASAFSGTMTTSASFKIGGNASGTAEFLAGNIDEVSAWSKELSASEITEIYNTGHPDLLTAHNAFSGNLVSWWRMGDGSLDSFPVIDDQIASNDGTMTNMSSESIVEVTLAAALPSCLAQFGSAEYGGDVCDGIHYGIEVCDTGDIGGTIEDNTELTGEVNLTDNIIVPDGYALVIGCDTFIQSNDKTIIVRDGGYLQTRGKRLPNSSGMGSVIIFK